VSEKRSKDHGSHEGKTEQSYLLGRGRNDTIANEMLRIVRCRFRILKPSHVSMPVVCTNVG
jgi:hypothetical protein